LKKVSIKKFAEGEYPFLPLENNRFVKKEGIIGIFDLDKSTYTAITRKFLSRAEREGRVSTASMGLHKSFILYDDGVKEQVYLSIFARAVIEERAK
jgi:hypothetical protein